MSITPAAGTYFTQFSATLGLTPNDQANMSLFVGGSQILHTERVHIVIGVGSGARPTWATNTQAIITANGSQTIDVRTRVIGSATVTILSRSLVLMKLS